MDLPGEDGWSRISNGKFIGLTADWLSQADALLLGWRTYDNFARDWPKITDPDDPFTERMNGLPKYVASNSLTRADWDPTTILAGEVATQVAELKRRPGRELQIHGSARLARLLLSAGLIDEMRLIIAPVVVGEGRRLFTEGIPAGLRLVDHKTTPAGLAVLVYESAGEPRYGTYEA